MAAITRTYLFGAPSFQMREAQLRFAGYSAISTRFRESHRNLVFTRRAGTRRDGNAAGILPIIRVQTPSVPKYVLDSDFYRPWRIPKISSALLKMGIRGVTVSDARGFGAQGGSKERQGGSEFSEDSFIPKVKMEIVVRKDQVEDVIAKIIEEVSVGNRQRGWPGPK